GGVVWVGGGGGGGAPVWWRAGGGRGGGGGGAGSAKVDPRTAEQFFSAYVPRPPYLRYGVAGPDGRVTHHTEIDLPGPRLPHDMAITEHHSILMDLPLVADPEAAKAGRRKLMFDDSMPARYGVNQRQGRGDTIKW